MANLSALKAQKGSQKWIQEIVNSHSNRTVLDNKIRWAFKLKETEEIIWKSPLAKNGYKEYQDQQFLDILKIKLEKRKLDTFWPTQGGPHWDALAKTGDGAVILVEAKSHINEIDSTSCQAREPSLSLIRSSLDETKQALNSVSKTDWSTCFYQYSNRLAFLYLLRQLNDIPAYLVNLYFVNDIEQKGPSTEEEWMGAIHLMKKHLGLRKHKLNPYTTDIFIRV